MTIQKQLVYRTYKTSDQEAIVLDEQEVSVGSILDHVVYSSLDGGYQPSHFFGDLTVKNPDKVIIHTREDGWYKEGFVEISGEAINEPYDKIAAGCIYNDDQPKIEIQENISNLRKMKLRLIHRDIDFNKGEIYTRIHHSPSKER